jgi:hypothetical protein
MKTFKKIIKIVGIALSVLVLFFLVLSFRTIPKSISYGVSFSKFHSDELGLPYRTVLLSLLDDLNVRRFRLSAHWPMIEPEKGKYNFNDLDFQLEETHKRDAKVVLALGRRLPGWPECHDPDWAKGLSWDEKKKEILSYLETVVNHYKQYDNIEYWQVENEPFLSVFAQEQCGTLDKAFLKEEIALVKKLDPSRPVLVTDSGNLGLWKDAWRVGDAFGTSVYMYLWNPTLGQVRSIYLPSFYRTKTTLMEMFLGKKKSFLIELSLEPWLLEPIAKAPLETQIARMDTAKFDEIISFAKKTGFDTQYLWGAEWWYSMKERGHGEYWERAKQIFNP